MVDLIDSQDAAIASYSYEDIEEGFGYVTYYAATAKNRPDGGPVETTYILTKQLLFSGNPCQGFKGNVGTVTLEFLTPAFARPRVLKGTIYTNASTAANLTSGKAGQMNIRFYHFDGSTSTQIGVQHHGEALQTSSGIIYGVETGTITAASPVKFKRGDQLKMEVDLVLNLDSGYIYEFGCDPQNRNSDGHMNDESESSGTTGELLNPSSNARVFTQFLVRVPFNLVT